MEATVGPESVAFTGEHAGRILALPLEWEHPGGVGEESPGRFSERSQRSSSPSSSNRGKATRGTAVPDSEYPGQTGVAVLRRPGRPVVEQLPAAGGQPAVGLRAPGRRRRMRGRSSASEQSLDRPQLLAPAGDRHLGRRLLVVAAHRFGHLGQVAGRAPAGRWRWPRRRRAPGDRGQDPGADLQPEAGQPVPEMLVEGGDAVVGEAGGDRAEHGKILEGNAGMLPGPGQLAADVPQGVLAAPALELVDGDGVGEVEHVDLLELGRRPELRGHHVQGQIDCGRPRLESPWPMPGVSTITRSKPAARQAAMASSRQSGSSRPEPRVAKDRKNTRAAGHGGPGSMEFIRMRSPSRAPPPLRRVGSMASTATLELVLLVEPEPPHHLVGQRRLARASRSGDAEHRGRVGRGRGENRLARHLLEVARPRATVRTRASTR